ncbi:hypothetical protein RJ641_003014 [Dillenia turbinata]|uniref:Uncharacterized protein n=1 Tax=Dillenia turbinata TaxID=194707 RepID=A0AAN8VJU5_9MAGN
MGSNIVSQIVRIGDIIVETSTDCTLTLRDTRHILYMRMNPLSINVLDNEEYESQQKNAQWKLLKEGALSQKFQPEDAMHHHLQNAENLTNGVG